MVITRYAPSPTGKQHIGNLRTALFSYLLAKSDNGKFILRIEDTDQKRFDPKAKDLIKKELKELGIVPDEEFTQSGRLRIYQDAAQILVDKGAAYRCYCTKKRLESLQNGYDYECRGRKEYLSIGKEYIVRLKMPIDLDGSFKFNDAILGDVEFKEKFVVKDPVILKSDGWPTYHLASVVDDHLMKVNHVLRSQEWLPSTPIHLQLYKQFDWEAPKFVHLPTINDETGKKLSKRSGVSINFSDLLEDGILLEAILNYLGLLGWRPDNDEEIFSMEELIKNFSLKGLNKSPAIFDVDKLNWYNKQYIMKMTDDKFEKYIENFYNDLGQLEFKKTITESPLKEKFYYFKDEQENFSYLNFKSHLKNNNNNKKLLNDSLKSRISNFKDIIKFITGLYPIQYIHKIKIEDIRFKNISDELLKEIIFILGNNFPENESIDLEFYKNLSKKNNISFKKFMGVFRLVVTMNNISLPLDVILPIIGLNEYKRRVEKCKEIFND